MNSGMEAVAEIFEKTLPGQCFICKKPMAEGAFICLQCNKPCKAKLRELGPNLFDGKSVCCNADFANSMKMTCSDECHEKLVKLFEEKFGAFKVVVDVNTGLQHMVPTRHIIEKGLRYQDLWKYPVMVS